MKYPLMIVSSLMIVKCVSCGNIIKFEVKPNKDESDYDVKPICEGKPCRTCKAIALDLTKRIKRILRRIDKLEYEENHVFEGEYVDHS